MPKIYKIKVYLTHFEKGQPVSSSPLDDVFTFKDVHQLLIEKGMKVRSVLGHFRNELVEYFEHAREMASIEETPDEEIPKFFFFPKGVKRYAAKEGYAVEVLSPSTSPADDE